MSFLFPLNQEGLGKFNNPIPPILSPSLGEMGRAMSCGSGSRWADEFPEPAQKGTLFGELAAAASPMPHGVDHRSAKSAEAVQSRVTENVVAPKPELLSQKVRTTDFMFCISKVEEYQSSDVDAAGAKLVGLAEFFDKNLGYGGDKGPKWVDPRDLRVGAVLWALFQAVFKSGWDRLPIDANNLNSPLVIGALRNFLQEGPALPPADGKMDINLPESTPITPGNKGKKVWQQTPPAPSTNVPGPSRHQGAINHIPGSETKVPSTQSAKRPAAAVVSHAPPPLPVPKPKVSSSTHQCAKPEAGPQTPKVPGTNTAPMQPQGMSYASAAERSLNATRAEPVPSPRGSGVDAGKLVGMGRLFPDLEPERLEAMCHVGFGDGSDSTHVPSPTPSQGRGGETIAKNSGIRRFVWEHLQNVNRDIQRVKHAGGTFSASKSHFCVPTATVVGHLCTYEGRLPETSRVQKIIDWPLCTTLSDVRGFLGTLGTIRIFIPNFAAISRPLVRLTKKGVDFEFGEEEQAAMNTLKDLTRNSPFIRALEYSCDREVILSVDTSHIAVGYILSQLGEDQNRYPSRFGSITLNERESRNSQAKLELFGLFRALKDTKIWIIGVRNFVVEVDAKYIKGMINNPDIQPSAAINRWISAILLFHFCLRHVPGKTHGPDGLSRRPRAPEDPEIEDDYEEWIDSANSFSFSTSRNYHSPSQFSTSLYDSDWISHSNTFSIEVSNKITPVQSLLYSLHHFPHSCSTFTASTAKNLAKVPPGSPVSSPPTIPRSEKAKRRDLELNQVQAFLTNPIQPPDLTDKAFKRFIRYSANFFIQDEKLWRKDPKLKHKLDVRWFVQTCHECPIRLLHRIHIPPTVPRPITLFRKAYIDTMLMPKSNGFRYIVHACCSLSSYPEFCMLRAENARTLGTFIFEDILCRWGAIEEIVTDNGPAFVQAAEFFSQRYKINHIRISPYNSRANGPVKRRHFDVREALVKAAGGEENRWTTVAPSVFWAEQISIQKSTGYSPYYLAHGIEPLLPFNLAEATYLAPSLTKLVSTTDLIAARAIQLQKRPEDLARVK
ncbi:hypothetical protein NP233_g7843 [Leucocoprinus birnbaumii]|uniref:Integrase catalytic domain-containing protein n=1 Tax=Leucocoprinus birnbaumii TaxID=56174 RepID=A0AAD5VP31_9AGAR|nr:hypothetical protein NP233_g7843 [Leucocoprinus birnbaumii]